ncbi:GST super [Ancistrocladus abbreviatus]
MGVKVYGPVTAACVQRVLACLIELEEDFQVIHVDLETSEHKQPPFGVVPVFEDGDFRLFESRAIIRYPAAKNAKSGTKLLGINLEERALVDQWLEVEAHNFNDLVYNMVLNLVVFPKMGKPSDMELVDSCKQKLKKVMDVYEDRLSKSKYLAGESFTMADLSHLPAIRYLMNEAGFGEVITERKNVNAWWKDISSRAAWEKVLKLQTAA